MSFNKPFCFALSAAIFLIFIFVFWDYSIDDAFITFRYAENFADGFGLSFNPNEKAVEGYSNFLWLLIMSLIYRIGLPTYLMAKILGTIFVLSAGAAWFFFLRKNNAGLIWLAGPLFLICPITAFWAVSGLELGLHTFLIAISAVTLLRNSKWLYLILPFLILNRPEGVAIAAGMVLTGALVDRKTVSPNLKYYLAAIILILLTTLGLTIFRIQFFGYVFPNTFYSKIHHNILWGYKELGKMLLFFLPISVGLVFSILGTILKKPKDKKIVIFGILFLIQVFISASVDPIMNFLFRYLIPFLPIMLILALSSVSSIRKAGNRNLVTGLFIVSLMIPLLPALNRLNQEKLIWEAQEKFIELANTFPDNSSISMTDMGRIPYYSDKIFFDLWGLINEEIAHNGFNPKREFLRLPDYFVMVGYLIDNQLNLLFVREKVIARDESFPDAYEFITICFPVGKKPTDPGYYYFVFKRKTGALEKYLNSDYTI